MKRIIPFLLLIPTLSFSQVTKQDSLWAPFRWFAGEWTGDSEGQPGKGKYERVYEVINSENEFVEIFELAEPGKDFEVYSKATLKRVK